MEDKLTKGHIHPLTNFSREIVNILSNMDFSVAIGPEIETDFNNFEALNIPGDHPARDMHDTIWLKNRDKMLLRTHTSPVQIRYMKENKPPIRIISPGRVYRKEATDVTHDYQFYQIEGLAIDKDISISHLKSTLDIFFKKLLGKKTAIRLRAGYFPFVEPGFEVDAFFQGKWVEVMGAGMVHPKVLSFAGINPRKWRGFAFGGGIDRLALAKYEIPDIRLYHSGDIRFINQF